MDFQTIFTFSLVFMFYLAPCQGWHNCGMNDSYSDFTQFESEPQNLTYVEIFTLLSSKYTGKW